MRTIRRVVVATLGAAASLVGVAALAQQGSGMYRPTATIKQVMDSMVAPTAQMLWDAVGVEVTESGVIERAPKTDEDWAKLRWAAVTMAEATNSLIIPGREVDNSGDAVTEGNLAPAQIAARIKDDRDAWVEHAHALNDAVGDLIKAIDARDLDGLTEGGGTLDEACESCHLQFWYPPAQ